MDNLDDILTFASEKSTEVKRSEIPTFNKATWSEQKKREREQIYALIDKSADSLSKDGSMLKEFLDIQSKFDRYSVANNLLILAQNHNATKLADYKAWEKSGTPVIKGESGITILEPGNDYTREDGSVGVMFKTKKVFDISQTSSKQQEQPTVKKDERILIRALINDTPVPINISDNLPSSINALYKPDTKEILIRKGLDGLDIFKALSQELAHAQMDKGGYKRGECIFPAYCVSYILCKRNGLDVSTYSFEHLPEKYGAMEAKDIRAELSIIRDTANDISSNMSKILEPSKSNIKEKDNNAR